MESAALSKCSPLEFVAWQQRWRQHPDLYSYLVEPGADRCSACSPEFDSQVRHRHTRQRAGARSTSGVEDGRSQHAGFGSPHGVTAASRSSSMARSGIGPPHSTLVARCMPEGLRAAFDWRGGISLISVRPLVAPICHRPRAPLTGPLRSGREVLRKRRWSDVTRAVRGALRGGATRPGRGTPGACAGRASCPVDRPLVACR
jgi:hypothetical protein